VGELDFEAWYREAWPALVGSLALQTGDPELAREAAAEAASRAWEQGDRVGAMDAPTGWAYRVAVNVTRRRGRRRAMEDRLLRRHLPAEAVPVADSDAEIWAAVAALPAQQRTVIALRYVLDLSQAQIAVELGVAPGTVAASLHKARRRLASVLDAQGFGPVELVGG
jgi:RNA polymerase sigma factor (sigma-70 family)